MANARRHTTFKTLMSLPGGGRCLLQTIRVWGSVSCRTGSSLTAEWHSMDGTRLYHVYHRNQSIRVTHRQQ